MLMSAVRFRPSHNNTNYSAFKRQRADSVFRNGRSLLTVVCCQSYPSCSICLEAIARRGISRVWLFRLERTSKRKLMAIRIVHMKIAFAPSGIVWAVWMKALFCKVCPETVNIRNVKNQPPPLDTGIAVFEIQNRIPVFCAERCEI